MAILLLSWSAILYENIAAFRIPIILVTFESMMLHVPFLTFMLHSLKAKRSFLFDDALDLKIFVISVINTSETSLIEFLKYELKI